MKMYRVSIGGQPRENGDTFDERESAEGYALRTAKRMAREEKDERPVALYGGPGHKDGWGACPSGDEGGYYPRIEEIEG